MPIADFLRNLFSNLDLDDFLDPGGDEREEADAAMDAWEVDYQRHSRVTENYLRKPPQIDLQDYIDQLGGYGEDMLSSYLRSAGQTEATSQRALQDALQSSDAFLSKYRDLARQDIPGMDIYRGRIGAQTASGIGQLKDIGGLTARNVGQLIAGEGDQRRDLALQSGMYRAQRQQDLANAYGAQNQMNQSAYGNRMAALGSAAGMRGQGYAGAANMTGAQAGLQEQQFYYNQSLPWQSAVNYHGGMSQQLIPYEAQAQYHSSAAQYDQARMDAALQAPINAYNNMQSQVGQLAMMDVFGGTTQGGGQVTGMPQAQTFSSGRVPVMQQPYNSAAPIVPSMSFSPSVPNIYMPNYPQYPDYGGMNNSSNYYG